MFAVCLYMAGEACNNAIWGRQTDVRVDSEASGSPPANVNSKNKRISKKKYY